MKIGFDFENGKPIIKRTGEHEINSDEEAILNELIKYLDYDETKFKIKANSTNYTTLYCNYYEMCRLKSGAKSQWISVNMDGLDVDVNDPLFELEKNKNQLFWKSDLRNLNELIPLLNEIIEKHIKK